MTTEAEKKAALKSKLMLLLLFAVFAAPGIGAWLLYTYTDIGKDGGQASHGELILPVRQIENVDLIDLFEPDNKAELYRKWSMVYFVDADCERECIGKAYRMRQIRLAIGEYFERIQRVLVFKQHPDQTILADTLKGYQGQLLLDSSNMDSSFVDHFKIEGVDDPFSAGRLYLIDPLGNLMMSYRSDQNPTDTIKDLKKIFRVSRI